MQNKILDEQKSIAERIIFIRKLRKKTCFRNKSESQVVEPHFLKVDKSFISNYLDISNSYNDASINFITTDPHCTLSSAKLFLCQ